ncbi:hypothetical protein MMC20_004574 [Loxospora ochrophaea]|nr:hypothetical protein [Loxospora ochrophaea]
MSQTQIQTDSIEAEDPKLENEKKAKSRRPANTAFRQQRLKAWQPILTPKTVLPLFFIIGVICAPIGGLLLYASSTVQEISIDYTDCNTTAPLSDSLTGFEQIPSSKTHSYFKSPVSPGKEPMWRRNTTACFLQFTLPNDIGPPVLFYYQLTNFYQNHRRYVKSLDANQLKGTAVPASTISSGSCDPLRLAPDGRPYYPCGLIANSIFNDTFTSPLLTNVEGGDAQNSTYPMTNQGIAWDSDKKLYGITAYNASQVAVPPNWQVKYNGSSYTEDNLPNLVENEEFQVWMRTAGLPAFSKLALRNDNETMQSGTYQVEIGLNFPVTEYGGTKSILISTRSVTGGRNPFLGIAFVVVAGLCVLLGAAFTGAHLIKPRKLGDHTYLTWNSDQPSTTTSTGISRHGNDNA